jgi:hypothetical protein
MSRVTLLDPGGRLEPVRDALRECDGVSVERGQRMPRRDGVVGVLVPPEIPVDAAALAALPAGRASDGARPTPSGAPCG